MYDRIIYLLQRLKIPNAELHFDDIETGAGYVYIPYKMTRNETGEIEYGEYVLMRFTSYMRAVEVLTAYVIANDMPPGVAKDE